MKTVKEILASGQTMRERIQANRQTKAAVAVANALKVMVLDPSIRAYLEANDPKALEQAQEALALEEAHPDCARCQGIGQIDQGYIVNGQITNLSRVLCPCITR